MNSPHIFFQEANKKKSSLISSFDTIIQSTDPKDLDLKKRTFNYLEWIEKKNSFFCNEKKPVHKNFSNLKRGSVVWIDFGFNIGNEFGGKHPAIILRKTSSSVFVLPLSSQQPNNLNATVEIDKVYGLRNMKRWTNVLRLQSVSEKRIDYSSSIGNVKGPVLDNINIMLKNTYIF